MKLAKLGLFVLMTGLLLTVLGSVDSTPRDSTQGPSTFFLVVAVIWLVALVALPFWMMTPDLSFKRRPKSAKPRPVAAHSKPSSSAPQPPPAPVTREAILHRIATDPVFAAAYRAEMAKRGVDVYGRKLPEEPINYAAEWNQQN